ncbi:MAG TPA: hypothetical protein VJN92_08575, partial [Candidatus Acidoferrum sp.]|nr:hypothetical protein [Candidatus Acidoferrum sp.]
WMARIFFFTNVSVLLRRDRLPLISASKETSRVEDFGRAFNEEGAGEDPRRVVRHGEGESGHYTRPTKEPAAPARSTKGYESMRPTPSGRA